MRMVRLPRNRYNGTEMHEKARDLAFPHIALPFQPASQGRRKPTLKKVAEIFFDT